MNLVELTEFIVKSLVKDADLVSVKEIDSEDNVITIQVLVSNDDMGAVIGKGGMISKALRTLVQASSNMHEGPKVKIDIDGF